MRQLALLLVVGCANDVGLEVRPPAGVEVAKVELFIGKGPICTLGDIDNDGIDDDCPGIGPPAESSVNLREVLPGDVFHVDHTDPFTADVVDGAARFRLEAASERLPVIVAVGTGPGGDQNSVAVFKELSLDAGARNVIIDLVEAGPVLTKMPEPVETNVAVWPDGSPGRSPDQHACVGAEFLGRRVFVVPEGDRDCDTVAFADECNPLVFEAVEIARDVTANDATCTFRRGASATEVCRVGDRVCDENVAGTVGCDNTRTVCISSQLCDSCAQLDNACVMATFQQSADISMIKCRVSLRLQPDNSLIPCTNESLIRAQLGGICSAVELSLIGHPLGPFPLPSLDIDTGDGKQLALRAIGGDPCSFELRHIGEFPPQLTIDQPPSAFGLWAKFLVPNGVEALIPVIVEFDVPNPACPVDSSRCDYVEAGTDLVDRCLNAG